MEHLAVSVSSFVNVIEDLRLPMIPYDTYIKTVLVGIPIAVLLHDAAEHWMPTKVRIPIISWFMRRWRGEADAKTTHLRAARNLLLFAFFVAMRMDQGANAEAQPSDYVEQRLTNPVAQRSLNQDIYKARSLAFGAADELLGEEEMNMVAVQQQRDAVLRRRHVHESRSK